MEIKNACDSDIFENIFIVINGDKEKYDKVIRYLSEQGNLCMKLRVMTMHISDPETLMITLMTLGTSDSDKINRLCKDGSNPVLHFSMYKGLEVLIRVIAHAQANLDIVGAKGVTPLIVAKG